MAVPDAGESAKSSGLIAAFRNGIDQQEAQCSDALGFFCTSDHAALPDPPGEEV